MNKSSDNRIETILAQAGSRVDAQTGGLAAPIQPATTFARGPDYKPTAEGVIYGRDDVPIYKGLEEILAALEGVRAALVFPSGMAALSAVVRSVVDGGAIVAQKGVYYGTSVFLRKYCARHDIQLTEVDATDIAAVEAAVGQAQPNLVMIETPSNPWLGIVDIAAVAEIAHEAGALLMVDSTAATPLVTRPAELGADIVVHSATKMLNGHSDVLAGVVVANAVDTEWWTMIRAERREAGAVLGTFEAWLLLRGLRTLALRLERAMANAMKIAAFLDGHAAVDRVLYPGLPHHPGHEIARRQMRGGFGSLMSFLVPGGEAGALAVAGAVKTIARATSLGGVETLIEHRYTYERGITDVPPNLLRLSIGIEHADDLIADLQQALATIRA
ncbi:MAG: PLP-dependent transferase [Hyphomicrobiales bacterium]|nr:PLP-dependent transferase [Hyphomicrobiales bacterium]